MLRITSSSLRVVSRPAIAPVTLQPSSTGVGMEAAFNLSRRLEAVGSVTFDGQPGDSMLGWQVGFVQAQWIETNWGAYQGAHDADGSVFLQRARPPSRPHQACFDNKVAGTPFYVLPSEAPQVPAGGTAPLPFVASPPLGAAFPATVQVFHADRPGDAYDLARQNTRTGQPNFLHEVQLEFAFCVILVAQAPTGVRHFLKGFYWNVNWQNRFTTTSAALSVPHPLAAGTKANVGHIFSGAPTDKRFASILTTPQANNCNTVAGAAAANPNVREEPRWHMFDVRR